LFLVRIVDFKGNDRIALRQGKARLLGCSSSIYDRWGGGTLQIVFARSDSDAATSLIGALFRTLPRRYRSSQ
jgi:hypothetical protein